MEGHANLPVPKEQAQEIADDFGAALEQIFYGEFDGRRRQAGFWPLGADLLRRIRRPPQKEGSREDYRRVKSAESEVRHLPQRVRLAADTILGERACPGRHHQGLSRLVLKRSRVCGANLAKSTPTPFF